MTFDTVSLCTATCNDANFYTRFIDLYINQRERSSQGGMDQVHATKTDPNLTSINVEF